MPIGAFRLNTLAAAMAVGMSATGGTIGYYNNGTTLYKIHTFTTTGSNNFVVTGTGTVDILLVGGGGAGGGCLTTSSAGGGGGGGAVVYQTGVSISSQTYTLSVGTGGAGVSAADGGAGVSSTGLGYTANGGGAGTMNSAATNGGGSGTASTTSNVSTIGTYAYKGGNAFGSSGTTRASGGGAGAGGAGSNAASNVGGNGGAGTTNNIDGKNLTYADGGGGSGATTAGLAGDGTSGTGTGSGRNTGGAGRANTAIYGGGGGGAISSGTAQIGGAGNQGIIIVRYPLTTAPRPLTVSNLGFTYDTSIKKYGTGSLQASGPSSTSLTTTTWALTTDSSDITIEGWYYFATSFTSATYGYSMWGGDSTNGLALYNNNVITLVAGGTNYDFTLGITLSTATWYHIAFTRTSAGSAKLWINGTQRGTTQTATGVLYHSDGTLSLGWSGQSNGSTKQIYIDDFRISNTIRYTGTFTAPTAALVNDANTVVLIHMDSGTPTDDNS
jgi:hypothetical protein